MNTYISAQIINMKFMVQTFKQSCQMGALKDDGRIDKDEARIIQKINIASDKFLKELENLK